MSIRLLWIQMLFPWFDCSISVWSIGVSGSKNVGTVSYKAIFSGEIPWKIGLIYGRYLQFRILKWPLIWNGTCMHIYIYTFPYVFLYSYFPVLIYLYYSYGFTNLHRSTAPVRSRNCKMLWRSCAWTAPTRWRRLAAQHVPRMAQRWITATSAV